MALSIQQLIMMPNTTASSHFFSPSRTSSNMNSRLSQQQSPDPYARSFGNATLLPSPASPGTNLSTARPLGVSPPESQTPNSQISNTSPQSNTPSSKATHICDQCSRAFSRAEHLERHQTTHLPSNATKSFVCTSCGKGFTRKDVLTRHIRAVHETKKSEVRKSRRKSCRRCAAFKIKCTGGGKGKESGERAEEPCEACRKRDVECIFDFGPTVEKADAQDQGTDHDMFDFGSDDARSEPETVDSSEYSVKRRKTIHHSGPSTSGAGMFLTPSTSASGGAVSPHLLSAARLASSQSNSERDTDLLPHLDQSSQQLELSSADQLISMATFANKSVFQNSDRMFPEQPRPPPPPRPASMSQSSSQNGFGNDFMSHLYFPPMRDSAPPAQRPKQGDGNGGGMMNRIEEEDLNAANTLQGINPAPSRSGSLSMSHNGMGEHWKNSVIDESAVQAGVNVRPIDMAGALPRNYNTDYSSTAYSSNHNHHHQHSRSPIFGSSISLPRLTETTLQNPTANPPTDDRNVVPNDSGGMDTGLGLHNEDDFYFDFGIFDNSTDWLRDWGPIESISPESTEGMDTLDTLPDASFGFGMTPNYGGVMDPSSPMESNVRDQPINMAQAAASASHAEEPSVSTPRPPTFPEDGAHVPGLPTVSPMKDQASGTDFLPWGWQRGLRVESSRKVTLPPLRQVLNDRAPAQYGGHQPTSSNTDGGTITDHMRKEMIDVLSLPGGKPPYPGCDAAEMEKAFPNKEVIGTFVKLYFEQFHPILPVIHRPTFSIERCPSILLIAMVSIGASYSSMKNAKAFADGLSELCKRCLTWMAENNPAYARSSFYLQSLCLQNLYATGSGCTSLYDAADVSRSVIIGNARRLGLFSGVLTTPGSSPSSAPNSPSITSGYTTSSHQNQSDLETRWHEWREKEGLKRLAWGIFEYDSSFSTLSNRRGAITISDVTIRTPCPENLWEAPTAAAWDTLMSRQADHPTGLHFYRTLMGIIAGRIDAAMLSCWGKRLCAQAMGRIIWDVKELEESVLAVGTTSFKPQKEKLLRSLMGVCNSATPSTGDAEGDRYHWILARLIAHYTHLHAEFPTISLMLNLARKPTDEPLDPRIKRLKAFFASDQVGARTLAWHAAQIIALSRWKPVFSPVEGMRLFLAGIVLWGFGSYYRPAEVSRGIIVERREMVRLDLLPWTGEPRGEEEWIRNGTGRPGMKGVREQVVGVCEDNGAVEVLGVVVGILGSLRVWGLGGEFKGVLEELRERKR